MDRRRILDDKLRKLLGSNNVYFQPPESTKMEYDAIRYKLSEIKEWKANDGEYSDRNCYEVMLITRNPTNSLIHNLLHSFQYIKFVRHYTANNLNHYVYKLYY